MERSATACSSTTRRCACRSSWQARACRRGRSARPSRWSMSHQPCCDCWASPPFDSDGIDLAPALAGAELPARDLYAESFAPLLDFGWSPLRALRSSGFKYIDAPRPELYDTSGDPGEERDLSAADGPRSAALRDRVSRYSGATLEPERLPAADREALGRLQALGYASGSNRGTSGARPDPKDRRATAARLSAIISGELQDKALESALRQVLGDDPNNPQANLRLGYVLVESNRCADAVPFLKAAIAAKMPTADAPPRSRPVPGCGAPVRRCGEDARRGGTRRAGQPSRPRQSRHRLVRCGTRPRRDRAAPARA